MEFKRLFLPPELISNIFMYVDDKKNIIPFEKYISLNVIRYLLRDTTIEYEAKSNHIRIVMLMLNINYTINWLIISVYPLSEEFIELFYDKLVWFYVSEHPMSEQCIIKFEKYVDWDKIARYQRLSNEFIWQFHKRLKFHYLSEFQMLDEIFIRKYIDMLNIDLICEYQILSESLIRDYAYKLNWNKISKFQFISNEFAIEFRHKINRTIKRKPMRLQILLIPHLQ